MDHSDNWRSDLAAVELVQGAPCGIELGLKASDGAIDLHQWFTGSDERKRLLHHLGTLHESNQPQERLRTLLCALSKPRNKLQAAITSIWVELDQADYGSGRIVPNVFVGVTDAVSESLIFSVLSPLRPEWPPGQKQQIARIVRLGREFGGRPAHFGLMMSRPTNAIRINFQGIQRIRTLAFLKKARWRDDVDALAGFLDFACGLSRRRNLAVDVDKAIGSRLGLELFPDTDRTGEFWPKLLAKLVECGLGDAQRATDLLAFAATLSPVDGPEYWPDSLMIDHLFSPSGHLPWMVFRLNHVKLSWMRGEMSAKIYLAAEPHWQRPSADRPDALQAKTRD